MLANLTVLLILSSAAVLSFVFALAESALFSLSPWQTKRLAEQFPSVRPQLDQLESQPQDLLATIVLGNTLANTIIGALCFSMVLRSHWNPMPTLFLLGLLLLVGCELIPKTIAVRLPERWTLSLLRPALLAQKILRPIHLVAQQTNERILHRLIPTSIQPQTQPTDADYQELVELGAQTGTLAPEEKEIILEIISLDEKTAADVMTPKSQIATTPQDLDPESMLEAATKFRHTRLLIQREESEEIIGVLDAQSLILNPQADLDTLMDVPKFIPETMNLWDLFVRFQKNRRQIAVVLDEYGETAGIVTAEDILEEITGPIYDREKEGQTRIERIGKDRWLVSGLATIEDFASHCNRIGEVEGLDTMGGLLASLLAHIPGSRTSISFRGLRMTAHRIGPRRIEKIIVECLPGIGTKE